MEHVNDLCFRDIYKGSLWEGDSYLCAIKKCRQFWGFINENANGTLFG